MVKDREETDTVRKKWKKTLIYLTTQMCLIEEFLRAKLQDKTIKYNNTK